MSRPALRVLLLFSLLGGHVAASPTPTEIQFKGVTGYSDPQFALTIRNDGTVEYVGNTGVQVKGRRHWRISPEDFDKLIRRIDKIGFFELKGSYDRYPLDKEIRFDGNSAEAERTSVTDLPSRFLTVVGPGRTKTVADRMGAPKRLYELEEFILDVTYASQLIGQRSDLHDVPFYDSFPINKKVTYRALLEHYSTGFYSNQISGYVLMFFKNPEIEFDIKAPENIDLATSDGCIVDATGYIKPNREKGHVFVLTKVRVVRREFLPTTAH